jgi:signal transduction histidine kinase
MNSNHWWSSARRSRETSTLIAERDRLVIERDHLASELDVARREISALTEYAGADTERKQLARVIQDSMSQQLTSLVLAVKRGRRELRTGNAPGAAKQFNVLEENLRRALTETRQLVATGAPAKTIGGLTTALLGLGESVEGATGISVTVRAQGTASLDDITEALLLAGATVALDNVRAHSGATAASVTINTTHDGVVLRVADNGRGFDVDPGTRAGDNSSEGATGGLVALRAQLEEAGGSLLVASTLGNGTSVTASLPAD